MVRTTLAASPSRLEVAAIKDIGALDSAAGQLLGAAITSASVWRSYGLPGSALTCSTNWPPGARAFEQQ